QRRRLLRAVRSRRAPHHDVRCDHASAQRRVRACAADEARDVRMHEGRARSPQARPLEELAVGADSLTAARSPLRTALSSYLNQMRWYSRLIGWRSRATNAASNRKLMIASE